MLNRFFPITAAALLAGSASAQPVLEEVVVRGEFRERPLADVPASVTVLPADAVDARAAKHLDEVLALVPNVNVAGGASRSRFFQIRGVGERGQFDEPLNPSVGLIVDGVDLSTAASSATLFDIEQVEVFRGPQGTRYGANALAGLVNVQTAAPTERTEARFGIDAANYDGLTVDGAVSGALSERVAGRFALQRHRSDGFVDNDYLGRDDTNERDELTLRGKLRWRPSDTLTVDALAGVVDLDNGYDTFSLDNTRTTLSDEPGSDAIETRFAGLDVDWDGADRYRIEANASASESDSVYGYDEDWVYEGFDPDGYSSTDYYYRGRQTFTSELRALSQPAGRVLGGRSDWVAGVYVLDSDVDLRREYTFLSGPFTSTFAIERLALFGQLETALTDRTTLTTGWRYERHRSDYADSEGVAFEPEDDLIGWRLSVDHALGGPLMGYASLARGYKAGGFNVDGSLDADLRQYAPEELLNLELGLKGRWRDGALEARVALFRMERDDVQIASSISRVRNDGSTEFIQFIGNAAEGTNQGLEAELAWRGLERFELTASVGLLDTEYDSFVNSAGDDLDGREQAHAPDYQFALSGRYDFAAGWHVRLGVEGRDAFYFSDSHSRRSDSYTLWNATLGYATDDWSVRLWSRNLTDEDRAIRGYFFGNDPRIGYAARTYTQLGEPRRVGLSYSRRF